MSRNLNDYSNQHNEYARRYMVRTKVDKIKLIRPIDSVILVGEICEITNITEDVAERIFLVIMNEHLLK